MKIIKPSYSIMKLDLDDLRIVEEAARTCYKSEGNIREGSEEKIIRKLIESGHESAIEHGHMTVKFIVDRGVSHEIVRHRLASYSQESTRYCNYSKDRFGNEITVIEPFYLEPKTESYETWKKACLEAEAAYFKLLDIGHTPQEARCVLPTSLKTELVMTANFREWRHFLNLRARGISGDPHPQMKEVAIPLLKELQCEAPILFGDLV